MLQERTPRETINVRRLKVGQRVSLSGTITRLDEWVENGNPVVTIRLDGLFSPAPVRTLADHVKPEED